MCQLVMAKSCQSAEGFNMTNVGNTSTSTDNGSVTIRSRRKQHRACQYDYHEASRYWPSIY